MAIFEDIDLEWEGVEYHLSGDESIMRVLAAVEEHITFVEIEQGRASGKVPLAKLSAAYAAILRAAGCRVTSAEVYKGMWSQGKTAQKVAEAISGLLQLMIPMSALEQKPKTSATPGKKKTSAAKRSRPRTKQR